MEAVQNSVDMMWVMLGTILVFFMHAGFAMLETGFTRSKNTLNILMKNLITVALGSILYFFVGFALMFGTSAFGVLGTDGFLLAGRDDIGFFVFQAVFAATCATIISGAVAERMRLSAYFMLTIGMAAIIYPVVGHWVWGGGWLSKIGFIDFAGSTVVHLTGATAAFITAWKIGPRLGKYSGKIVNSIPGHNLPLGALGVFILWVGWFGFNGGSTLAADPELVPPVILNTLLSASAAVLSAALYTRFRFGRIDPSLTMNGALAGLVGITAGAANVSFAGALIIGLAAGVLMTEAVRLLDAQIRVDDPVGAIAVHGAAGIWGTLALGIFDSTDGLLYGGGAELLGIQTIGILSVIAWTTVSAIIVLAIINSVVPLRVSAEDEENGLDFSEHGSQAYAMQDVLSGAAPSTESFAQRLNQLGEHPAHQKS